MPYINTDWEWLDVSGLWDLDKRGAERGGKYFTPHPFPQTAKAMNKFRKEYRAARKEYEKGLEQIADAELIDMTAPDAARHRADLETKFVLATANARQNLLKKTEGEIYRAAFLVLRFLYANGGKVDADGNKTVLAFVNELEPIMDSLRGTDTDKVIQGLFHLLAIVSAAGAPVNAKAVEQTYKDMETDGREAMENLELYFTNHELLTPGIYREGENDEQSDCE